MHIRFWNNEKDVLQVVTMWFQKRKEKDIENKTKSAD